MNPVEAVVIVMVVGMTVGIPLLGVTIRLSVKPLIEAWLRLREAQTTRSAGDIEGLKVRVAALEAILDSRGMLHGGFDPIAGLGAPLELLPAKVKREKS